MVHGPPAMSTAVRSLAAVLVLALSGVVGPLAVRAPAGAHRCSCLHGARRECECGSCRRRNLESLASDPHAPPCHREAAREALDRRTAKDGSAPCLDGACGGSAPVTGTMTSLDPALVTRPPSLATRWRAERVFGRAARGRERTLAPEIPPPRPA